MSVPHERQTSSATGTGLASGTKRVSATDYLFLYWLAREAGIIDDVA